MNMADARLTARGARATPPSSDYQLGWERQIRPEHEWSALSVAREKRAPRAHNAGRRETPRLHARNQSALLSTNQIWVTLKPNTQKPSNLQITWPSIPIPKTLFLHTSVENSSPLHFYLYVVSFNSLSPTMREFCSCAARSWLCVSLYYLYMCTRAYYT